MRSNQRTGDFVIESFARAGDAEAAIRDLRDAGFRAEDISVVSRDEEQARSVSEHTGADTGKGAGIGAATGGVLGGIVGLLAGATALAIPGVGVVVAGPIAAALGAGAAGAVTGGLAGALAAAGVADDRARDYEDRVNAGDILVIVDAGTRVSEARRILERTR